jgi:hypothetical protein
MTCRFECLLYIHFIDLELSTSTLPVTTSLINILVTTSLTVTDHFEEYQAKSSNLLLGKCTHVYVHWSLIQFYSIA